MKHTLTFVLFFLFSYWCNAQQYTVKGAVNDTLNKVGLYHASVVLERPDSVIETFTRAKPDGSFVLHPSAEGKYTLIISYPDFVDYTEVVNVNKSVTNIGNVPLTSRSLLLKEFVLTQQVAAIKIKGDTTEYMADSFKVKENATVEELLKRLPGITVDKNGQVTAQGETVQKILVDGEEFFSDDPAVVTKGLQANAVDRVQVYDKKSDQTEFTGIDDGQKTKTINLQLKEDKKKKGYFGKLDAGAGTDGYYQNQAMVNAFKGKRQLSAFVINSNTDKIGLGWSDNDKFSSGNGTTEITDDGQIMSTYTSSSEDFAGWDGKYNGQGLPKVWTGGLHFANRWDEDKEHFGGNYRYAMQNVELIGNTLTENVLPNSVYYNREDKTQFSTGQRHSIDGVYDWKIDSMTSIKLAADAGYKHTETQSEYVADAFTPVLDTAADTLNKNTRNISSKADAQFINADFLLRRKFKKKGRTLSVDAKENYKNSTSDGFLHSLTDVYIPDTAHKRFTDSSYRINQEKKSTTNTLAFNVKATYTEPLSKVAFLELNYGITVNNSNSTNLSYDSSSQNKFNKFDSLYSSDYKYNVFTNKGGVTLRFVYKKVNFSFGSDVANAQFRQTDLLRHDSTRNYDYFNLFPKASFNYKIGKQTNFTINYLGSTKQPSIDQIAPLRQNTDPLNFMIGNTNLKQEFDNTINFHYNDYKVLTNRYLWIGGALTFIQDAISNKQTIANGIDTVKYVNVNGNYNGWMYAGYGFKLKKLDMRMGVHANIGLDHITNYINTVENANDNTSYDFGLDFDYYKQDKYQFSFRPGISYNDNHSTISTYATSYISSTSELSGTVQLPHKFEVNSSFEIFIRERTAVFTTNNNVVRWNAYISKKFLKKSQLELRVSAFDILNQNIGYTRFAQNANVTENTYNTIRRYGMVNLIWNFTHTPAGSPEPTGGGMMMMR